MVKDFRMTELQNLLGFAGKNKTGKKNELQCRAMELLRGANFTLGVQDKIIELHRQRHQDLQDTKDPHLNQYKSGWNKPPFVIAINPLKCLLGSNSSAPTQVPIASSSMTSGIQLRNHTKMQRMPDNLQQPQQQHHNNYGSHNVMSQNFYQSMPRGFDMMNNYPQIPQNAPSSRKQYAPQSTVNHQYPVVNDVKFKHLPFFEKYSELLKPTTLSMSSAFIAMKLSIKHQ